jgi:hypothetical protein
MRRRNVRAQAELQEMSFPWVVCRTFFLKRISGVQLAEGYARSTDKSTPGFCATSLEKNRSIKTNSFTLGGGESLDVIIDSTGVPADTYFL